jgi:hypothetical protein
MNPDKSKSQIKSKNQKRSFYMTIRNAFKFVVVLALVFAVVGGYGVFTAKASGRVGSSVLSLAPSRVLTPKEILNFQRSISNNSGVSIPAGTFTLVDQQSMTCPGPGTCLYTADEWVQILPSAATSWGVFSELDGNFMTGEGPTNTVDSSEFVTTSWSENSSHVNPGSHKIQTYVILEDTSGTLFNYNLNYRIFKP